MRTTTLSEKAFRAAQALMPGGVNSPVRAYGAVGGTPPFIARGKGSRLWDIDGREYVDYVGSWGPMILGHAHPAVVKTIQQTVANGSSFGAPTTAETELAELIVKAFPSMEMVRLVSSGTEACMSAIRLARAATKRDFIVKFEGCYHGHFDGLLVKAGSGAMTFGNPTSPGVPKSYASRTFVLPYNNADAFEKFCEKWGTKTAAVIVEPVAGNMGVVPPREGFLESLRERSRRYGMLLIFDEVITGGGPPLAAYGGKRELMKQLSPSGPVYQAGTLSGNPAATAAGIAVIKLLKGQKNYDRLAKTASALGEGVADAAREAGILVQVNRVGSMLTAFFTGNEVADFATARRCDTATYARFFHGMKAAGFLFAPSQFEAAFTSLAHTDADIDKTISACAKVLKGLR